MEQDHIPLRGRKEKIFQHEQTTVLEEGMNDTNSCTICFNDQRKTCSKYSKWRTRGRCTDHTGAAKEGLSYQLEDSWCVNFVCENDSGNKILAESTGISYTEDFMRPQKKKSSGLRSGERGDQATGPPRLIHRAGYLVFKKCRTVKEKCAGALSCISHMSL